MMVAILTAMRANAEATIRMVDALIATIQESDKIGGAASDGPAVCEHPSEARLSIPSMGNPQQFRCGLCGAVSGQTAAQEGN